MNTATITQYPLTWPQGRKRTPPDRRQKSRFSISRLSFVGARTFLLEELRRLMAKGVILSTNVTTRRDGLPYADQREPADTGVAVYFTRAGRDQVFACDRWNRVVDNMWAIGKTIEALRGIERWGSGDMVEAAFTGFSALPPGPVVVTPETWQERFVRLFGMGVRCPPEDVRKRLFELVKEHHPDRGGDAAKMAEINDVYARWKKEQL